MINQNNEVITIPTKEKTNSKKVAAYCRVSSEFDLNHSQFLGYSKDKDGNLIIVEDEAKIVRLIFNLYLQGKLSGEDMERIFSYPTHYGDSRNPIYTGFELLLADGWIFQIRNVYADLFLEFTRDTDKDYPYFDENGDLSKRGIEQNKTKALDIDSSFFIFTPVDIDNDGVYEIMTAQYSYLYGRSDAIGSCYTILKWDTVKQLFEIVQAGFWPYSNEDSDAWQEYESIWYRKEFL